MAFSTFSRVVSSGMCRSSDWLIALLHEYGCREVVLIHPNKRSRRKTDRRDAAKLSELLWPGGERLRNGQKPQGLRRVVIPSADDQADRQLTALRRRCLNDLIAATVLRHRLVREMVRSNTQCVRKRIGQQRTRSINKMKNILRRHNLGGRLSRKRFSPRWLVDSRAACPFYGTTKP